ncbi:unnamed protein product [Rhizophagus irregularis]|nr:unnamed protein product [Rhizophagus irregularis]
MDIDFVNREDVIYEEELIEPSDCEEDNNKESKLALKLKELEYREKDLALALKEHEFALRERETKNNCEKERQLKLAN